MSNVVPFDSANLPAHITQMMGVTVDDLSAGMSSGFPVISIKGKVFHIVRGDERQMLTSPTGEEGQPASYIDVVILKANPALSKVYYAEGYVEGSVEKPTCMSNDGVAPSADAAEPQSKHCATCVHNQWGSKVSESGQKLKACSDVRRIAVSPSGQLNDAMLLRIPGGSLRALAVYGDQLKKRGVKYPAVVTRISFDYSVAHPALTFKPVGFISPEMVKVVEEMTASEIVAQIVGAGGATPPQVAQSTPAAAIPAPTPAVAPAPAPKVEKPAAKPAATAAPKATKQASKLVTVDTASIESELDKLLAGASFDDAPTQ